ncbi:MAG: hypothetical protein GY765_42090 [bacterium]|nr:hypothetical protein [bacterium]
MSTSYKNKIFKIGLPVPPYGHTGTMNMEKDNEKFPFPDDCSGMRVKREVQWDGFDTNLVTNYEINRDNFSFCLNGPQSVTTIDMGDYTKVVDKEQKNYRTQKLLPDGTLQTVTKTHIRTNTVNMPHDLSTLAEGEGVNPEYWGKQTVANEFHSTVETALGNTVTRQLEYSTDITVRGVTYRTGWTLLEKKDVTGVTYFRYENNSY